RVGDWSYSLYLVHWPAIAFLKNAWVGPSGALPLSLRLAAVAFAFVLGYPLYRFVERPLHRANFRRTPSLVPKAALVSLAIACITPATILASRPAVDFKEVRRVNFGMSEACEYQTPFRAKVECGGDNAR